uniref:hypothetical protein n=1 Tax=Lachnoclostridium phocaeense TaxID=1871021 RepID=UPI0026DAB1D4|nr:hypothetical protein [Lachnoclostridium phocaeense]
MRLYLIETTDAKIMERFGPTFGKSDFGAAKGRPVRIDHPLEFHEESGDRWVLENANKETFTIHPKEQTMRNGYLVVRTENEKYTFQVS